MRKPLLVSSGEPAGIGPDICLTLVDKPYPIVVVGDITLLRERAQRLGRSIHCVPYQVGDPVKRSAHCLAVLHVPLVAPVIPGQLAVANADYVLRMLALSVMQCQQGFFSALITAPIQKSVINEAGVPFTGHTEFLAQQCGGVPVVMMLACAAMKMALVTTHLPLRDVADTLTPQLIQTVIRTIHTALRQDFGLMHPLIYVSGLNPHAGEGGHLGHEERTVIAPALVQLQAQGIRVEGPFSADTLFATQHLPPPDIYVVMYHDQGLPVLKYVGFGEAVNVTLGLPIIRTSVDHGTALPLAGTGKASASSLWAAVDMAADMVKQREKQS